jgi:hypothetical protein
MRTITFPYSRGAPSALIRINCRKVKPIRRFSIVAKRRELAILGDLPAGVIRVLNLLQYRDYALPPNGDHPEE